MTTPNIKHRNHYIPKFLLKNWQNEEKGIFVYNSERHQIQDKHGVERICFLNNLYVPLENNDNSKSDALEDDYSQFENEIAKTIHDILSVFNTNGDFLSIRNKKSIKSKLFRFVVDILLRNPEFISAAEDDFAEHNKRIKLMSFCHHILTSTSDKIGDNYSIAFYTPKQQYEPFLMSSNPVVFVPNEENTYSIIMPLSPILAVSFIQKNAIKHKDFQIVDDETFYINGYLLNQNAKYYISHNKMFLEYIKDVKEKVCCCSSVKTTTNIHSCLAKIKKEYIQKCKEIKTI